MKITDACTIFLTVAVLAVLEANSTLVLRKIFTEPQDKFCLSISPHEPDVRIALLLNVDYPTRLAEAGRFVTQAGELNNTGTHRFTFKHIVTNMMHDLSIELDGISQHFIKSAQKRWYTVSTFASVALLTEGYGGDFACTPTTTQTLNIPSTTILPASKLKNPTSNPNNPASKPKNPESKPQNPESKPINHATKLKNPTSKPKNGTLQEKKKVKQKPPIFFKVDPEKTDASERFYDDFVIGNLTIQETPVLFNRTPYEHFYDDEASVTNCGHSGCDQQSEMTLTYALVGALSCLVVVAIVISVVFHRKKQKIVAQERKIRREKERKKSNEEQIENGKFLGEEW